MRNQQNGKKPFTILSGTPSRLTNHRLVIFLILIQATFTLYTFQWHSNQVKRIFIYVFPFFLFYLLRSSQIKNSIKFICYSIVFMLCSYTLLSSIFVNYFISKQTHCNCLQSTLTSLLPLCCWVSHVKIQLVTHLFYTIHGKQLVTPGYSRYLAGCY